MNKYQRAAALDLIKAAAIAIAGGLSYVILAQFLTPLQVITVLAIGLLVWCGYNLFQIRVDQYRTLDEIEQRKTK